MSSCPIDKSDQSSQKHSKIKEHDMQFTSTPVDQLLLDILSQATIQKQDGLFILEGMPQMDRKLYDGFKKILSAMGGRWDGKTHRFDRDPSDHISEIVSVGKYPKINPYSLFETPDHIVDELLDMINVPDQPDWDYEIKILEPNAGRGAIARKIRERLPNATIHCVEIDPINREVLEAQGFTVVADDFLSYKTEEKYDFVAMNPPFKAEEYIKHINKAYTHLIDRGRLGAIAPMGACTSQTKLGVDFRNFVAENGSWDHIGAPFEFTKCQCLMLEIKKLSASEKEKLWSKTYGYSSWFAYELMFYLDNEPEWHKMLERGITDRSAIGDYVDSVVTGILSEGTLIYYTQQLKNYAVDQFLSETGQPVAQEVELTQLSFA
jgi:predicted RNA methylase